MPPTLLALVVVAPLTACSSSNEGCETAADCPSPDEYACVIHVCKRLCNDAVECPSPVEECREGLCEVVANPTCTTDAACVTPNQCEISSGAVCAGGECLYAARAAETQCDDQDPCTESDACNGSRVCVGVAIPGACGPKKPTGESCSEHTECESSHCECADSSCSTTICGVLPCQCQYVAASGIGCAGFLEYGFDDSSGTCAPLPCNGIGGCGDLIAPTVSITGGQPADPTSATDVSPGFTFSGSDFGGSGLSHYECELDGGGYFLCTSPAALSSLTAGRHTFSVRAVDHAGNAGTPDTFSWTVWWLWVDGGGVNGLNHGSGFDADEPHPAVFAGKLYATWREFDTDRSSWQIRVVVYNGDDDAPSWSSVDGDGPDGINYDPLTENADHSSLVPFAGKLYAIWHEKNATSRQIRVAVYNGNDADPIWTFVDGGTANGINYNTANGARIAELVVFNGKLYATWYELSPTRGNVRVKVYNGNDSAPTWTSVDGGGATGLNADVSKNAYRVRPIVFDSKLYLMWEEANATAFQIRVRVYNGNDDAPVWTFLDGGGTDGINKDPKQEAKYVRPIVHDTKLYASWSEWNASTLTYQIRVAVYGGNDAAPVWTFVDGNGSYGINRDATNGTQGHVDLLVYNSRLHACWSEQNDLGAYQTRVAEYGGNDTAPDWQFVDGDGANGLNFDTTKDSLFWIEMVELDSRLYLLWMEPNGTANQIRARVYAQ